jgi:hypothetical protein
MTWASLPDPKGISRITLTWVPSSPKYVVYEADETTLCRELSLTSPDLEIAAPDRLVPLRPHPFANARRAFTRVADNVTETSLRVELPRGSRMIHFYAVVPVSGTGVEGSLPAAGNDYIAVATPVVQIPEPPTVIARDRAGTVSVRVDVSEMRVRVGRVEIFRALDAQHTVMPEHAGPPIAVLDAATAGVRDASGIHLEFTDTTPGKAWQSTFYRVVAWAEANPARGIHAGRSPSSRPVEVVITSNVPPTLTGLALEDNAAFPDHRLFSFATDASLQETPRGVHIFAVHAVMPDGSVVTRRMRGNALPLLAGAMPDPTAQPDSIFRHDATNPNVGRTYAWVPHDIAAVIAEITDPAGRATQAEKLPP